MKFKLANLQMVTENLNKGIGPRMLTKDILLMYRASFYSFVSFAVKILFSYHYSFQDASYGVTLMCLYLGVSRYHLH